MLSCAAARPQLASCRLTATLQACFAQTSSLCVLLTADAFSLQIPPYPPYALCIGRWKPLSYYVRRSFAPLAVHVLEAWGKVEVWGECSVALFNADLITGLF